MVSIVVPTYNQAQYIDYTLRSVIEQSYENWECIIVDDGSTDYTEDVVRKYTEKDSRFKYFKKGNEGASSARNYGLNNAKGDFIQFLDSDDFIHQDKLLKSIRLFDENKDSNIIISNFNMFREDVELGALPPYCNLNDRTFDFNSIVMDWDVNYTIPLHCALFSKILFDNLRFDQTIQSKEDWIMWVSIFKNGAKATYINESLAFYRYNDNGNHTNDDSNFIKANQIVYNLLNDNFKFKLFEKNLNDLTNKLAVLKKCQTDYQNLEKYYNNTVKIKKISWMGLKKSFRKRFLF